MPPSPYDPHAVARHFRSVDPTLAAVIDRVGPFGLKLDRNRFGMLVRSIISQQISTSAARSIRQRLIKLVAPERITPASISRLSLDELRGVGLSGRKAEFVHELAQKVNDGALKLSRLARLEDEAIIEELVELRGVGRWTAQMFLIFSLGRLDVFPYDDFGVRSAIRRLYGLSELPGRKACLEIGACWTPYASIASWYCWRSLELPAAEPVGKK